MPDVALRQGNAAPLVVILRPVPASTASAELATLNLLGLDAATVAGAVVAGCDLGMLAAAGLDAGILAGGVAPSAEAGALMLTSDGATASGGGVGAVVTQRPAASALTPLAARAVSIHQIAHVRALITGSTLMSSFVYGTRIRLTGTFRDAAQSLFDPAAPRFDLTYPSARQVGGLVRLAYAYPAAAQIVRDGVGLYHLDLLLDVVGVWRYTWRSLAAGAEVVVAGSVSVVADPTAP